MSSELQQRSDEDLARQAQAGSLAAFEELVSRYERRIHGFVLQFCPNAADAAELTQETFVKAFRNLARYSSRHPFAGWLFTIARHNCIDHHRAAPPASAGPVPDCPGEGDPAATLTAQEDRDTLWALARRVLPAAQFQALWLSYAADMQVREIAAAMNRTCTHIKVMLFRARRTLRRALEASQPDLPGAEPRRERALTEGRARLAGSPPPALKPWALPGGPAPVPAAAKLGPIPGT